MTNSQTDKDFANIPLHPEPMVDIAKIIYYKKQQFIRQNPGVPKYLIIGRTNYSHLRRQMHDYAAYVNNTKDTNSEFNGMIIAVVDDPNYLEVA